MTESVVPVIVDPTPVIPMEPIILSLSPTPVYQQSPNGQWWELKVDDAGAPQWKEVVP